MSDDTTNNWPERPLRSGTIDLAPTACFRDRKGHRPRLIVIHTMEGSLRGTVAWFKTLNRPVMTAAHYLIGTKGDCVQMVEDDRASLHAGNMEVNRVSFGIEHEGHASDLDFQTPMLLASAYVTANLCRKYGLSVDRQHIIGHVEVPRATHHDPGPHWPWERYMKMVEWYFQRIPVRP